MLTDRDVIVGPVSQAATNFSEFTIGEVMTTPAITVCESDSLDSALTRMRRQGVRRMPVVDQTGSLSEVLTVDDVIGHVTDDLARIVFLLKTGRKREQVDDTSDGLGAGMVTCVDGPVAVRPTHTHRVWPPHSS